MLEISIPVVDQEVFVLHIGRTVRRAITRVTEVDSDYRICLKDIAGDFTWSNLGPEQENLRRDWERR